MSDLLVYEDIKSTKLKIQQSGMYGTFYGSVKGKKRKDGWGGSKKMSISERKLILRWAFLVKLKTSFTDPKVYFQFPGFNFPIAHIGIY